jgi:predicted nuclease of restriction endonuclease-like (RecB) superfamily
MPKQPPSLPDNYEAFVRGLKERVHTAQIKAALAVNKELVMLYWQLGRDILQRQEQEGWGAKVIDQLSKDLKREFPDNTGFSPRNLKYMRAFAEAWRDEAIVQQLVAQIPWGHNVRLLDMVKSPEERLWYAQQTIENGWSRNVLVLQIESGLIHRSGQAVTNFSRTLPSPQSDLAQSLLKDPYNLEFLTISKDAQERELERALVNHIRDFLLELGMGFAFLGNQYPIEVDGREFRLDLLFYHVKLHSYIVVELKMGEFEPEHSGKMNFYVAAVDNILRSPNDNRTIGIILCRSKRKTIVEYSLQGMEGPIGVSAFTLPAPLNESLPTVEQLEMELNAVELPPEEDS